MHWLTQGDEVPDPLAPYEAVTRTAPAGRPYVLANMVVGLDGSAAVAGRVGVLSSPADARLFTSLRMLADVVLVGAGTVRAERYGPVKVDESAAERRRALGRVAAPRIAVVTRSLDLDWTIPMFTNGPRPIIVTSERAAVEEASEHADVLVAGGPAVDLALALRMLREQGNEVVLCEGGPRLLGELVAADLLDELCMSLAPMMGGDALPLAVAPAGSGLSRFDLAHALVEDSTLFLRYERRAP